MRNGGVEDQIHRLLQCIEEQVASRDDRAAEVGDRRNDRSRQSFDGGAFDAENELIVQIPREAQKMPFIGRIEGNERHCTHQYR